MSKNYFLPKTGHDTSDEYFKRAPIYCDSDILKAGVILFLIGFLVGVFLF
jgi:hypothetical protein